MNIILAGPLPPYRGGIARHTGRLAQALAEAGSPPTLLTLRGGYPGWLYPGRSSLEPDPAADFQAARMLTGWRFWQWPAAARWIANQSAAALILPWWTPYWGPAFGWLAAAARRQGLRVLFVVHNALPHEARPLDRLLTRLALRQGQAYIVHNGSQAEVLARLYPDQPNAHFYPHPPYDHLNEYRLPKDQAREALGLPTDRAVLLQFGFQRAYKGLSFLLDVLVELRENSGQIPLLLVVGEHWNGSSALKAQVLRLGLGEQVRWFDRYVSDQEAGLFFSAADLLVAPYRRATQSGALKLALGFGLPALASAGTLDPRELPLEGLRILPAEDAAAWARGIAAALREPLPAPQIDASAAWAGLAALVMELAR